MISSDSSAGPRARGPLGSGLLPAAPPAPRPLAVFGAVIDWIVVAIGAVMISLVFVNVVLRTVGHDLAAVTELAELLMVWVTFLSGACAARRGAQMTITEFIDKLGVRPRMGADMAINGLAMVLLVQLIGYGSTLAAVGWGNELTVLQIPMTFQYLGMPIGAFAMLVWIAYDTWLIVKGRTRDQRWPKG